MLNKITICSKNNTEQDYTFFFTNNTKQDNNLFTNNAKQDYNLFKK